jgi:hypothetical protein
MLANTYDSLFTQHTAHDGSLESENMKVILVFLIHKESFITILSRLVAIPINCVK